MLAVGLAVGAGCSSGNAGAQSKNMDYDFEVLDTYMSDARDPVRRSSEPLSLGRTASTKSLDRSSASKKSKRPVPRGKFPKGKVFGKWEASIDMAAAMNESAMEMEASGQGDPQMAAMAAEMGRAMAEMMSSMFSMSLDLHKDYTFDGLLVGMTLEGNWKQTGDRLYLTPTKVMGKTEKELKKMAETMSEGYGSDGQMKMKITGDSFEPLELRITEGGKALIAINALDSTDQDLVFRRKK